MGTKNIYNRIFLNVLCILFIKRLMANVRKMLQMNNYFPVLPTKYTLELLLILYTV